MECSKDIFDKITSYYDISDKIRVEILKLDDIDEKTKFDVLIPVVDKIKQTADVLTQKYVGLMKDSENQELRDDLVNELDQFLEYIRVYKNKLYNIYKDK
jgi:chemotaxis regulatin CheY-phosphate phosphatase CheZ